MFFCDPGILLAAAQAVYQAAQQVKANQKQCGLLAHRIKIVVDQLNASKGVLRQLKYQAPLTQLKSLLEECKEFIEQFHEKSYLQRLFWGDSYNEHFIELNNRLKDASHDLQLEIDARILGNLQEFHDCAETDRKNILAMQSRIQIEIREQFRRQERVINSLLQRIEIILAPQQDQQLREAAIKRVMIRHAIPYKDLNFEKPIATRSDGEFYCGKDLFQSVWLQKISVDPRLHERFIHQVAIHGRLCHRNILKLYNACFEAGNECLVLEPAKFFLVDVLDKLTLQQQAFIANDVLQGLDHLHKIKVKHGNLSASNIALTEKMVAKLTRFDYAHAPIATVAELRLPPLRSSSRSVLAPEQLRDITQELTPAADIYSFGLLLYVLATKTMPEEGQIMNAETLQGIESPFLPWIIICCNPEPLKRPTTQDLIARVIRFQGFVSHAAPALPQSRETYQKANDAYIAKDFGKAVSLYQQAIREGSARAKTNLAVLYWEGKGVAKNPDTAFKLWQEAAHAGDPKGMYNLAECLKEGVHRRDKLPELSQALYWYTCAADLEYPKARDKADELLAQGIL